MATINNIATSNTLEEGRVLINTNMNNVNVEAVASTADLVTHKASADHDARYSVLAHNHAATYAAIADTVNVTGAQTVAGAKTFTSNPIIATGNTSQVEFQTAALGQMGRVRSTVNGVDRGIHLDAWSVIGNQYLEMIRGFADDATVDTPYADLYIRGKAAATQEYVQARIRSGTYQMVVQKYAASLAASTSYWFMNSEGGMYLMLPILGSRLSQFQLAYQQGNTNFADIITIQNVGYTFDVTIPCVLYVGFATSANDSGVSFTITFYKSVAASPVQTAIFSITSTTMGLAKLVVGQVTWFNMALVFNY